MKFNERINLKAITLITVMVFAGIHVFAQQPKAGFKGGLNVSNLYVDEVDDENARLGFHIGIFGQVLSSDVFALQPELLYTTKGTTVNYDGFIDQETDFNLNYLELPVLAVFKLGEAFEIHAGGYGSYLLSANINTDGDLGDDFESLDRDNFNTVDYGLVGGIGLNFGALQVGARYNYGLREIAKNNSSKFFIGDSKNSLAQLYLALNFNQE